MTRTDIVASSRPQAVGAASIGGASGASRRFLGLTVALLLAAALGAPATALAAGSTGETGYSQTPTTPKTTPTTTTPATTTPTTTTSEPKSGTSPSKESAPAKETSPTKTTTTPTTTTEAAKAQTLPFTGLDLRWIVAGGILMLGAGFSIVVIQRRQRRDG